MNEGLYFSIIVAVFAHLGECERKLLLFSLSTVIALRGFANEDFIVSSILSPRVSWSLYYARYICSQF